VLTCSEFFLCSGVYSVSSMKSLGFSSSNDQNKLKHKTEYQPLTNISTQLKLLARQDVDAGSFGLVYACFFFFFLKGFLSSVIESGRRVFVFFFFLFLEELLNITIQLRSWHFWYINNFCGWLTLFYHYLSIVLWKQITSLIK
jgi:hypothetical protein